MKSRFDRNLFHPRAVLLLAAVVAAYVNVASACPFCTAFPRTLSDDLEESTAAVLARCESASAEADGFYTLRMRITGVIKGDPALKNSVVEVATAENERPGDAICWLVGYGDSPCQWASPKSISSEGVSYLQSLEGLPERGPQRLKHFLGYLQHPDELVAADAYNEFAEASLADIAGLSDRLQRPWVISQIRDVSVPKHRRRLCWTFLSQCGKATDTSLFDESLRRRQADATFDPCMDSAISCLIALGGEKALARVEGEFLANPDADYLDSFAAVSAIRVHGTELEVIPRPRLAKALRHLLDRPELADLVISDLARWGDWSAIDRVVELFETSTEETSFLKPACVRYLKNCPLPAAEEALNRLREIDGEAVQLAESSMLMHAGLASLPVPPPDTDEPAPSDDAKPAGDAGSASPRVAEKPQELPAAVRE